MKHVVLYCNENTVYYDIPGIEVYDFTRNSLNFKKNVPVIAHPPCRLWSKLKKFSTAPESEKFLAISAVNHIRENGGVLEHPEGSSLFRYMKMPLDSKNDDFGGFTISVDQCNYGFQAKKRTWLYIVGCSRSDLPILNYFSEIKQYKKVEKMSRERRADTTLDFALLLINILEIIKEKQKK